MPFYDGPNKRIILNQPTGGVLNVNVQDDLYETGKRYVQGRVFFDTETDVGATQINLLDYSLHTGQRVVYFNDGGTENIGLTDNTAYFVRFLDRQSFELYDTKANAENIGFTTGRQALTASGVGNGETHQFFADNSKWFVPWRTTGGDPLTPGVEAGAYFFIQNQLGSDWRIIAFDEDHTINYAGNLVAEDSLLSLIVPTPGRTVLHLGLQPVTQRVDEILLQSQIAAYNGQVAYDSSSSNTGSDFPVGTLSFPVNNVPDLFDILTDLRASQIVIVGPITFDRNVQQFRISGFTSTENDVISLAGFDYDDTFFQGLTLQGTMTGRIEVTECKLNVVLGLNGFFRRCGLEGALSTAANADLTLDSCFSRVPGLGTPSLSIGANSSVGIRNWSGGLEVRDMTTGCTLSMDMDPGKLVIDSSCTGGVINVRGIGELEDNSGGAVTIARTGLLDTVDLDTMIQSAVGNADVSSDDLTVTIRDPALNVIRTLSVSADGRIRRIL